MSNPNVARHQQAIAIEH